MFAYLKESYFYHIVDPVKWWKRYWAGVSWLLTHLLQTTRNVVMLPVRLVRWIFL